MPNSMWNGNYSDDEGKRRKGYDRPAMGQVNKPRKPWTTYEQEFTRHPSKDFGYAGTGKRGSDD